MPLISIKSDIEWINQIASIPILGEGLAIGFIFIPTMIISLMAEAIFPALKGNGIIWLLIPGWAFFLWKRSIQVYFFFSPAWATMGLIAIVHAIILISAAYNGQ